MLKIALIGAGSHSRAHHAPSLAQYQKDFPEKIELTAICDLDESKARAFAENYGFKKVHTDHRKMIAEEKPDGCVCVMPIPHIVGLATELLEMGMPCTVEKPLGASVAEGRRLVETARKTGTPHMVSVDRRFQPLVNQGKAWALAQGPVRFVRASMLRRDRREDFFVSGTAIHCLDCLRHLAGEITATESHPQSEGTPWFHFVLKFASGAVGSLDVLPSAGCLEERYEICGEGYRVNISSEISDEPRLQCWKQGEKVIDLFSDQSLPDIQRLGPYAETDEFVTGLLEKRAMYPTVEDVFPSMELSYALNP